MMVLRICLFFWHTLYQWTILGVVSVCMCVGVCLFVCVCVSVWLRKSVKSKPKTFLVSMVGGPSKWLKGGGP